MDITSVSSVAGYPTEVADTGCTTQDFPPISYVDSFGMVDTSSVVLKSSHVSNAITNADHCSTLVVANFKSSGVPLGRPCALPRIVG
jgi:hypothetical protein